MGLNLNCCSMNASPPKTLKTSSKFGRIKLPSFMTTLPRVRYEVFSLHGKRAYGKVEKKLHSITLLEVDGVSGQT